METIKLIYKQINKTTLKKMSLLLLGCTLIFSCKNSKIIPVINLSNIDHSISLDITDILSDISMVQISADFLLSSTDQIYVTSKYLIIYINSESLHLFSRDGAYIRKLAEKGNGPGEFYGIHYFFADEEECILYYLDNGRLNRLNRIDINSGTALDPLQIDFTYTTINYINGKIYSFPHFMYAPGSLNASNPRSPMIISGEYPDSAIVFCAVSLPSGEKQNYPGYQKYTALVRGSSITSYYDEITVINLGYSDTLFTLKDNKLSPLCILYLSDKMTNNYDGGSGCEIVAAYKNGIVLSQISIAARPPRITHHEKFFALYDRKGNVYRIENTIVMSTPIKFEDYRKRYNLPSAFLPIICGKYGYMLVEHDVLENLPANFDPDNDNPIIIVGTLT